MPETSTSPMLEHVSSLLTTEVQLFGAGVGVGYICSIQDLLLTLSLGITPGNPGHSGAQTGVNCVQNKLLSPVCLSGYERSHFNHNLCTIES